MTRELENACFINISPTTLNRNKNISTVDPRETSFDKFVIWVKERVELVFKGTELIWSAGGEQDLVKVKTKYVVKNQIYPSQL